MEMKLLACNTTTFYVTYFNVAKFGKNLGRFCEI